MEDLMTEALHIYLEDDPDAPGVKTSRLEVEGDDWTFLGILDALGHEAEVVRSRMVETGIRQVMEGDESS